MLTPLAWRNVTHKKVRTAVALTGVCFAIVLIFMQLGFYDVAFRASTMILDQFAFDIALVSPQYTHLRASGTIPRARLAQVRSLPGVASASPLYVATGAWRNPESGARRELPILGVDPDEPCFALPVLARNAHRLHALDVALMDVRAQTRYGPIHEGLVAEVENRRITVGATYAYGSGFMADASVIVGDRTLFNTVPGTSRDSVSVGLVRLAPGGRLETVMAELQRRMPVDVQVWSRDQLEAHEQAYFVKIKPLGLMFFSGVLLAFSVGAIILYQILSAEITNHLKEFATLMAMGYRERFLVRVVLQQATLFALLGFAPAVVMSVVLYLVLSWVTQLPMVMTLARLVGVLVISLIMCSAAGLMASRKLGRADPADLF
jgi:putative ABC transport system permease protein